jgi:hypothetical protein
MGGILQVDTIQNNNATTLITQTNSTTLTFGVSGQNIIIPSGVTFNTASATVTLPSTINATTINVTTLVLAAGVVDTPALTTSGDLNTGIFFPAADTIAFTEGGAEAMRINSSGNVGIGTTSPAGILELKSTGNTNFFITAGNTSASQIVLGDPDDIDVGKIAYSHNINAMEFIVNASERMRIDSSGDVMIGTTTVGNNKLRIVTFTAAQKILEAVNESVSSTTEGNIYSYIGTSAGTGFVHYTAQSFTQVVFKVFGNGNVQNLNNSYGSLSDIKIKKDIIDANSQWNDIKNIKVRKFRLKDDPTQFFQIGVVAQELEEVSPNLIEEIPDYKENEVPVLDNNGNPILNEDGTPQTKKEQIQLNTTTKSVKYSILYMKAIKALQEAMERIEQLETKNISLEARLTALENK